MPRLALTIGDYQARSVIASCQRSVNLFSEKNPSDAPAPFTYYNAPGLTSLAAAVNAPGRGLYAANNGTLYYCAGNTLYTVDSGWTLKSLGTIGTTTGIVSMADNGTTLVLVDGSANGYQVDLTTNTFSPITEATNSPPTGSGAVYSFPGADRADMLDGFMLFNQPGTRNFYCTFNNEIVFDALNFAAKNGYSDNLVSVIVSRREIWLLGERTSEIWFDAGGAAFPFQIMPGPFIQHGCSAKYSVAQVDGAIFWLSQDQAGNNIIARGEGYQAARISTHAMENAMASYPTTADAQAFCFQLEGHSFYQITFPSADVTWRWDETTQLWHEAVWTDSNGAEHRHRAACMAYAYGKVVVADWQTGQLYALDLNNHTDNGAPMVFRRGYPHLINDGRRVIYPGFILDCEAATSADTIKLPGPFPILTNDPQYGILTANTGAGLIAGPNTDTAPRVLLRWSDTRGRTWSQPVPQSLGATGQYAVPAEVVATWYGT